MRELWCIQLLPYVRNGEQDDYAGSKPDWCTHRGSSFSQRQLRAFVKSAAVLYLLPIIGFIIGAAVGASLNQAIGVGERTSAVLLGLGGLGVGFLITIMVSKWTGVKGILTPEITRIISRGSTDGIGVRVDPVCNMLVDPATAPASLEYRGTTYYFCNPGCKQAFAKDPGKYIG